MHKWTLQNKSADFDGIRRRFGVSAVTARLLVNRGKTEYDEIREFIRPTTEDFHSPELMKNLPFLADILIEKINQHKKIRIIGDYDADGIMSTYILKDCMDRLGADADYYIPDRIKDGYGINEDMINRANADGVDTVITCDNGIAAVGAADRALEYGITLLVTDHHELPDILPRATVIVDPKQPGENYPCRNICGAVVASKLAAYLLKKAGLYDTKNGIPYIEFMAIATVCDIVPLTGENHTIVKFGLEKLNHCYIGKKAEELTEAEKQVCNVGLLALINACEIASTLSEYHFGFVLGPCFNATGRLDLADKAMRLLREKNASTAVEYANECKVLNEERKNMTKASTDVVLKKLKEKEPEEAENNKGKADGQYGEGENEKDGKKVTGGLDKVLIIELPDCHESLAGIIAGRIRENFCRPTIVLTKGIAGMKGSGRSIPEYNMFEELKKCSDLFTKFGGHPMAAGISLPEENVVELRRRLNENCTLTEGDMIEKISLDAQVSFQLFTPEIIKEMELLAPFGQENANPLFGEKNLRVKQMRLIGKNKNFLKLTLVNEYNRTISAVYFGDANIFISDLKEKYSGKDIDDAFAGITNPIKLTAAYIPQINEYNGNLEVQMRIKNYIVV